MSLLLLAAGRRAFSDDTQAFHTHHRLCNVLQIVCQRKYLWNVGDGEIKHDYHFLIHAVGAQRHGAPTALAYIQPAFMHAAYLQSFIIIFRPFWHHL